MSDAEAPEPPARVGLYAGRLVLFVRGFALAVEGDVCRDEELCAWASHLPGVGYRWNGKALHMAAATINARS